MLSLRWVLELPDALLDRQSQLHRQDLLTRYPAYEQLRQQAHALHDKLIVMPIQPDDKDVQRQQAQMLAQLTFVSQRQELILREMAVRASRRLPFRRCARRRKY